MVTGDLPDPFEQLVTLGHRRDNRIRPVLLRVLVDMFVSKSHHNASAIREFEEIMAHLLDDADEEARLAVAEQLSQHPLTPPSLLDRFVAQRSTIAAKVLAHAGMEPRALNAAAVFGTTVMAVAVARRPDLDASVVRSLAERPEPEVLCALAENRAAVIDRPLFRYLTRRAQAHPELAARLLERTQPADAVSVFLVADKTERAELIASARRQDLGVVGGALPFATQGEMSAAIERAALSPGLDGLEAALAAALQCAPEEVSRLVDDPEGEPLAIALTALGVRSQVAARIFILGHPAIGHSYEKVKSLVAIVETVSARAASKLLAAMLGRPVEVSHRLPTAQNTGEPSRRGGAVATRHGSSVKTPAVRRFPQVS